MLLRTLFCFFITTSFYLSAQELSVNFQTFASEGTDEIISGNVDTIANGEFVFLTSSYTDELTGIDLQLHRITAEEGIVETINFAREGLQIATQVRTGPGHRVLIAAQDHLTDNPDNAIDVLLIELDENLQETRTVSLDFYASESIYQMSYIDADRVAIYVYDILNLQENVPEVQKICLLDLNTGETVWEISPQQKASFNASLVSNGNGQLLYSWGNFSIGYGVQALSLADGSTQWNQPYTFNCIQRYVPETYVYDAASDTYLGVSACGQIIEVSTNGDITAHEIEGYYSPDQDRLFHTELSYQDSILTIVSQLFIFTMARETDGSFTKLNQSPVPGNISDLGVFFTPLHEGSYIRVPSGDNSFFNFELGIANVNEDGSSGASSTILIRPVEEPSSLVGKRLVQTENDDLLFTSLRFNGITFPECFFTVNPLSDEAVEFDLDNFFIDQLFPHPEGGYEGLAFRSNGNLADSVTTLRIREDGTLLRQGNFFANINSPRHFNCFQVPADQGGGYLYVATESSGNSSSHRLRRISPEGDLVFTQVIAPNSSTYSPSKVYQLANGDLLFFATDISFALTLHRYTPDGELVYQQNVTFPGDSRTFFVSGFYEDVESGEFILSGTLRETTFQPVFSFNFSGMIVSMDAATGTISERLEVPELDNPNIYAVPNPSSASEDSWFVQHFRESPDTEVLLAASLLGADGTVRQTQTTYAANYGYEILTDGIFTGEKSIITGYVGNQPTNNLAAFISEMNVSELVSTTDFANLSPLPSITAYPNPTTDHLRIEWDQINSSDFNLTILNMQGQALRSWSGPLAAGRASIDLNVAAYPSGQYIIRVMTENGTLSKPFIKK